MPSLTDINSQNCEAKQYVSYNVIYILRMATGFYRCKISFYDIREQKFNGISNLKHKVFLIH